MCVDFLFFCVYFFVFQLNFYLGAIKNSWGHFYFFFFNITFIKTVVIFPVNRKQNICEKQHCLKQFNTWKSLLELLEMEFILGFVI